MGLLGEAEGFRVGAVGVDAAVVVGVVKRDPGRHVGRQPEPSHLVELALGHRRDVRRIVGLQDGSRSRPDQVVFPSPGLVGGRTQ